MEQGQVWVGSRFTPGGTLHLSAHGPTAVGGQASFRSFSQPPDHIVSVAEPMEPG